MSYQYGGGIKNEPTIIRGVVLSRNGKPLSLCGTASGYFRHGRNNEYPCPACKAAHREHTRAIRDRTNPGRARRRSPGAPVLHGTESGHRMHGKRKEVPCEPCLEAHRLASQAARDAKRAA